VDPRDSSICKCVRTHIYFGSILGLPYTISKRYWSRGVPHISVTHTPLAAVLVFNKFLNLKNLPHIKERGFHL